MGNLNDVDAMGPAFIAMSDKLGRYEETRRECEQIVALLGLEPGARILDAGCGFGRTVGVFQALGFDAVGVDISPAVIAEAEQRNPGPTYLVHDLTQPLPDDVERFDAIVNVYSSFGYGETVADDAAVLRTWHDALKPGGALVMELSDIERSQARLGPLGTVVDREDDGVHEHLYCDPETHVLHITYTMGEDTLKLDTRLYEASELAAMVAQAGFPDVQRYGGFDAHPKQPTDRLVLVARK
ncbi:MAG TPA: class I SAM-dependent methyltransferase [Conexibacter sp.]|nr:class I SAM-dependent methyltransferase [Conexibacter sp.]